eukprot:537498-Rhodomonas_salina.2
MLDIAFSAWSSATGGKPSNNCQKQKYEHGPQRATCCNACERKRIHVEAKLCALKTSSVNFMFQTFKFFAVW